VLSRNQLLFARYTAADAMSCLVICVPDLDIVEGSLGRAMIARSQTLSSKKLGSDDDKESSK